MVVLLVVVIFSWKAWGLSLSWSTLLIFQFMELSVLHQELHWEGEPALFVLQSKPGIVHYRLGLHLMWFVALFLERQCLPTAALIHRGARAAAPQAGMNGSFWQNSLPLRTPWLAVIPPTHPLLDYTSTAIFPGISWWRGQRESTDYNSMTAVMWPLYNYVWHRRVCEWNEQSTLRLLGTWTIEWYSV